MDIDIDISRAGLTSPAEVGQPWVDPWVFRSVRLTPDISVSDIYPPFGLGKRNIQF